MRNFFDNWLRGVSYLITDDLISYYTYFTMVLAEVAYLWGSFPKLALPFTCILIASILNIVVSSLFKGRYEGTKREVICARAYVITFISLFIIGLFFNPLASVILFATPIITTALWIMIRNFQDSVYFGPIPKIIKFIGKLFRNPIIWIFSQIIVIALPFGLFAAGIFITSMADWLKTLILVAYLIIAPFIAVFKDYFATCNIFELAYDVNWKDKDD